MRKSNSQEGFTLIELILVIGILTIAIGVSSDIILTLIKSYNKSQINNQVEQNADFVLNRLQRDLTANAISIVEPVSADKLTFTDKNGVVYTYKVASNGASFQVYYNDNLLTDDNSSTGVKLVDCALSPCFTKINPANTKPYVIKVKFEFVPAYAAATPSALGNTIVETTLVIRSTY